MRTILIGFILVSHVFAEPVRVPKEQFRSKEFIKGFVGSFGFLSPVEPKVDREESELLADLADLFSDARFREAEATIVDFIKKRKNPVEEGVKPRDVSPALIFQLAQLYYMNDRTEDAERAYKLAIKGHPDFRRAHKYLALLYASQDRISDALPYLKRAIQLGEADQLVYGLLGYAYTQEDKALAAEGAYRQAYLLNPDETQWKSGLALSLYQQEKWVEAAAMLGELLAESPESGDFWKMQANCYLNMEQPLRAATNFEVMRLKDLADQSTLNTLGDIYTDQRKPVLALGAYLAALSKGEVIDAERSLRTAKVLSDYGAPREAAKYIAALTGSGKSKLTRNQNIALKLIEVDIAKAGSEDVKVGVILEEVLKLDPMNGGALVESGLWFERLSDAADTDEEAAKLRAQARARFTLAMKNEDKEMQYLASRSFGQMLVRQREFVDGLPYLEKALELKPSDNLGRFVKQVTIFAEKEKERKAREEAELKLEEKEREERRAKDKERAAEKAETE